MPTQPIGLTEHTQIYKYFSYESVLIIVFLHIDNLPIRTSKINPMKTYPSEIIVFCNFVRRFTSTVLISVIVFVWSSVLAFSGSFALTGGIGLGLLDIVSFRLSLSSQALALARSVSARAVSVVLLRPGLYLRHIHYFRIFAGLFLIPI